MSTLPLSQAKTHLTRLLNEVEELGEEIVITRSGRPVAVLLAVDEYEGMLETLEILADPELSEAVRRGLEEEASDESVSAEELWGELDSPVHS